MLQFYKKRDFGTLVSDTLNFFKLYGRNYFKNYITLNGGVIILLVAVIAIGYGDFIKQLFNGNASGESYFFQQYFQQNQIQLVIVSILVFVLIVLLSLIMYSFPVLYIKRLSETNEKNITTAEILDDIKKNIKKFFVYFVGSVFILTPIFVVLIALSSFLVLIFIGILLLILVIPVMVNIMNFTLFNIYNTDDGFFKSMNKAFGMQFSKNFWKYTGSTLVIYMLIQVISSIFTMIPFMFLYGYIFTAASSGSDAMSKEGGTFTIIIFVVYLISILCSLILSNLIYVNSGLMYYDSRADLHRNVVFSEIDTIGAGEE